MAQQQSRIQLRGISYAPSNRMVQDGGVCNSMNVQLKDDELVPTPKPGYITDGNGDALTAGTAIYIHKTNEYAHYITIWEEDGDIRAEQVGPNREVKYLMDYDENTVIDSITHVGNMLIISVTQGGVSSMHYFLYKDGKYEDLDTKIPHPDIRFYSEKVHHGGIVHNVTPGSKSDWQDSGDAYFDFNPLWANTIKDPVALGIMDYARGVIEQDFDDTAVFGQMRLPVFLRYAMRLYDGSVINVSAPVLLGNFDADPYPYKITINTAKNGNVYQYGCSIQGTSNDAMVYKFKGDFSQLVWWKDIIEGIDIYCSLPVRIAQDFTKIKSVIKEGTSYYNSFELTVDPENTLDIKKRLLSYTDDFRLFRSYTINELLEKSNVEQVLDPVKLNDSDWIATQSVLPANYKSCHTLSFKYTQTLNTRLIGLQGQRILYKGYPHFNGPKMDEGQHDWQTWYTIEGDDGKKTTNYTVINENAVPSTYISYPDARCTRAIVQDNTPPGERCQIVMTPSATGDFAHAFLGWGESLMVQHSPADHDITVNDTEDLKNRIVQSDYGNPYSFPASGYMTFSASVTAVAQATRPLSTGQFGEYPLYVFTDDGIEAVALTNDGSFMSHKPMSRDISISRRFITPIDQEVVFLSRRGVMLISGGDIVCLSASMVGKQPTLLSKVWQLIKNRLTGSDSIHEVDYFTSAADFLLFMQGAQCIYDYAGSRLLFFNTSMQSAASGSEIYIYRLETRTWHKQDCKGEVLRHALNSYPNCWISSMGSEAHIMDFTTPSGQAAYGLSDIVIYTRPFDFGQPDVLKSIYSVKIRSTKPDSIKYVLMGSQDNINFDIVPSLKGKSYKFYQMLIVGKNMGRDDAISWVDFTWEPRFTNKLR